MPMLHFGQLLGRAQTLADAGQSRYDLRLFAEGSIMTLSSLDNAHVVEVLMPAALASRVRSRGRRGLFGSGSVG